MRDMPGGVRQHGIESIGRQRNHRSFECVEQVCGVQGIVERSSPDQVQFIKDTLASLKVVYSF